MHQAPNTHSFIPCISPQALVIDHHPAVIASSADSLAILARSAARQACTVMSPMGSRGGGWPSRVHSMTSSDHMKEPRLAGLSEANSVPDEDGEVGSPAATVSAAVFSEYIIAWYSGVGCPGGPCPYNSHILRPHFANAASARA